MARFHMILCLAAQCAFAKRTVHQSIHTVGSDALPKLGAREIDRKQSATRANGGGPLSAEIDKPTLFQHTELDKSVQYPPDDASLRHRVPAPSTAPESITSDRPSADEAGLARTDANRGSKDGLRGRKAWNTDPCADLYSQGRALTFEESCECANRRQWSQSGADTTLNSLYTQTWGTSVTVDGAWWNADKCSAVVERNRTVVVEGASSTARYGLPGVLLVHRWATKLNQHKKDILVATTAVCGRKPGSCNITDVYIIEGSVYFFYGWAEKHKHVPAKQQCTGQSTGWGNNNQKTPTPAPSHKPNNNNWHPKAPCTPTAVGRPTATGSATASSSPSSSSSASSSQTGTSSATASSSSSSSPTTSASGTVSGSATGSATATSTGTASGTSSPSSSATASQSRSPTSSATSSASGTASGSGTTGATTSPTSSGTSSSSSSPSSSGTASGSRTSSPSSSGTASVSSSSSPSGTSSKSPSSSATASSSGSGTASPSGSSTSSSSSSPSATGSGTTGPSPSSSPSASGTGTASSSPSSSASSAATATSRPTDAPTETPSASASASASPSSSGSGSASSSPSASSSGTASTSTTSSASASTSGSPSWSGSPSATASASSSGSSSPSSSGTSSSSSSPSPSGSGTASGSASGSASSSASSSASGTPSSTASGSGSTSPSGTTSPSSSGTVSSSSSTSPSGSGTASGSGTSSPSSSGSGTATTSPSWTTSPSSSGTASASGTRSSSASPTTTKQVTSTATNSPSTSATASHSAKPTHTYNKGKKQGNVVCWGSNNNGELGNAGDPAGSCTGSSSYDCRPVVPIALNEFLSYIDTGVTHTCGISNVGNMYCWGQNNVGQLGTGLPAQSYDTPQPVCDPQPAPAQPQGNTPVTCTYNTVWSWVSTGDTFTCALDQYGNLYCWGASSSGQLGVGSLYNFGNGANAYTAVPLAANTSRCFTEVQVGTTTNGGAGFAIASDGTLWGWGFNANAQLGDGSTTNRISPIQVGILPNPPLSTTTDWCSVAPGQINTCAITCAGELYCWGDNQFGQVGNGAVGGVQQTAVRVCSIGTARNVATNCTAGTDLWADAGVDAASACAITTDGRLACWGNDQQGQLGNGPAGSSVRPTSVSCTGSTCPPNPAGQCCASSVWSQVDAGDNYACATNTAGETYCWGDNTDGKLGINQNGGSVAVPTKVDYSALQGFPAGQTWATVVTGSMTTCSITEIPGPVPEVNCPNVWCFGTDTSGALGNSIATVNSYIPTGHVGVHLAQMETGVQHSCGVTTDGLGWCWGWNNQGQIGDGTTVNKELAPLGQVCDNLAGTANCVVKTGMWSQIRAGYQFSLAIRKSDGAIMAWGSNDRYKLGTTAVASNSFTSSPVVVSTALGCVVRVSAGRDNGFAINSAGHMYGWGSQANGQVGDGVQLTNGNVQTPTQIGNALVLAGTLWCRVEAGYSHACAITCSGLLYCWGSNTNGMLGDGSTTSQRYPTQVCDVASSSGACPKSGEKYLAVSPGRTHTCAIKIANLGDTSGQLVCWGDNTVKQLGSSGPTSSTFPIYVACPPNGTSTCAASRTCCTTNSGWVAVDSDFVESGTGNAYSCATNSNGALYCWGSRASGHLGTGSTITGTETIPTMIDESGLISSYTVPPYWIDVGAGDVQSCALQTRLGAPPLPTCASGAVPGTITGLALSPPTSYVPGTDVELQDWQWLLRQQSEGLRLAPGAVFCFGSNGHYEIGDGDLSGEDVLPRPLYPVAGTFAWAQVSAGQGFACGVTTDGRLYCWGAGQWNQLGIDSVTDQYMPRKVAVTSVLVWRQVAAGSKVGAAIAYDGSIYTWGVDVNGRLGRTADKPLGGNLPGSVSAPAGTVFESVSGSWDHFAAVTTDGRLFTWGKGADGRLGTNSTSDSAVPTLVPLPAALSGTGDAWASCSAGSAHTCCVTRLSRVACWGQQSRGRLGNGRINEASVSMPVLLTGPERYSAVAAGWDHTLAITTDGTLYAWGDDSMGQTGLGYLASNPGSAALVPDLVQFEGAWLYVAAGTRFSLATDSEGHLWSWGQGGSGIGRGKDDGPIAWPASVDTSLLPDGLSWGSVSASNEGLCAVLSAVPDPTVVRGAVAEYLNATVLDMHAILDCTDSGRAWNGTGCMDPPECNTDGSASMGYDGVACSVAYSAFTCGLDGQFWDGASCVSFSDINLANTVPATGLPQLKQGEIMHVPCTLLLGGVTAASCNNNATRAVLRAALASSLGSLANVTLPPSAVEITEVVDVPLGVATARRLASLAGRGLQAPTGATAAEVHGYVVTVDPGAAYAVYSTLTAANASDAAGQLLAGPLLQLLQAADPVTFGSVTLLSVKTGQPAIVNAHPSASPVPLAGASSSSKTTESNAIVAIVLGTVIAALVVAGGLFAYIRRRRMARNRRASHGLHEHPARGTLGVVPLGDVKTASERRPSMAAASAQASRRASAAAGLAAAGASIGAGLRLGADPAGPDAGLATETRAPAAAGGNGLDYYRSQHVKTLSTGAGAASGPVGPLEAALRRQSTTSEAQARRQSTTEGIII